MIAPFLRAQSALPFQWGAHDCATFLADWVCARSGIDPAARTRGTYETEDGARRHFDGFGGLARAVGREMKAAGFRLVRDPRPGDVGVIHVPGELVCAVWTGRRWVFRRESGIAGVAGALARPVAVWGVECRRR
jgi:hypothetical protein